MLDANILNRNDPVDLNKELVLAILNDVDDNHDGKISYE